MFNLYRNVNQTPRSDYSLPDKIKMLSKLKTPKKLQNVICLIVMTYLLLLNSTNLTRDFRETSIS